MHPTSASIVAAIGRGTAFPFQIADGGAAWSMPAAPSSTDELRAAARGAIRACARVNLGDVVFARDDGALLGRLKGHGARAAVFDAVTESVQLVVRRHVTYVEQARVTGLPAAGGSFDGVKGQFTLRVDYQFSGSIEPVSDEVQIGDLSQAEAQGG